MAEKDSRGGTVGPPGMVETGLGRRLGSEARRLSSQHDQLDVFFSMVVTALGRGSAHAARVAFTRFGDALEAHMTLEDQVFFPALRGLDPRLTRDLTELSEEHTAVREMVKRLTDLLAAGSIESFHADLEHLGERIAAHESKEERVLEAARSKDPRP